MTINLDHTTMQWITYIIVGALGGFVAEYMQHGCLELPSMSDKKLYLGSLGGVIMGAITGCIGDSNPVNAFIWGLGGMSVVKYLMSKSPVLTGGGLINDTSGSNDNQGQEQGNSSGNP